METYSVTKRDGSKEALEFRKITERFTNLCSDLNTTHLDFMLVTKSVIAGVFDGVRTEDLDTLAVRTCASLNVAHPDYGMLAGRIAASSLQKSVPRTFSEAVETLYQFSLGKKKVPLVSSKFREYVAAHSVELDLMIEPEMDLTYNCMALETLKKSYLLKCGDKVIETPQYMLLRVAVTVNMGKNGGGIPGVRETYKALSGKKYIHASPTLFNAGAPSAQMASCFLLTAKGDSISGIYASLTDCAKVSQYAGGVGLSFGKIRPANSYIAGNNGVSSGIVPALKVFNETAKYVNQGGRRSGSFAIYVEPWHGDIMDFLQLRLGHGAEEKRTRELFTALWCPELFFERVKARGNWSLFDLTIAPELNELYGDEFNALYERYEREGLATHTVPALKLWEQLCISNSETGTPYLLNKDQANRTSNQKNLGTIQGSNLCVVGETEIRTDKGEISIGLLEGKTVNAWNGFEWSPVRVLKTGENKEVVEVTLTDGKSLRCTGAHQFALEAGDGDDVVLMVPADELRIGDKLFMGANVAQVRELEGLCDTYCFTEHLRGYGYFNGILTGQCAEIIEYSSDTEVAVCNLAAINVAEFVDVAAGTMDYAGISDMAGLAVRNLNSVIDESFYPIPDAGLSNERHRPIGLGLSGLQDVFFKLRVPFDSKEARQLNRDIYEAVYYGAVRESVRLVEAGAEPYSSFAGSPASEGKLQFDMWRDPEVTKVAPELRLQLDASGLGLESEWVDLKQRMQKHGLRNSLLTCQMPNATSASFMGVTECFEPQHSNIFTRVVMSGEFVVTNKYLVDDLDKLGLWGPEMAGQILKNGGSVQGCLEIPKELRDIYKTAWEISQKHIIDMSFERSPFIDQSQSLNLYMAKPTLGALSSMYFYAYDRRLKTMQYYLRSKPATEPVRFTARGEEPVDTPRVEEETECLACQA
jgi:ribonucleotide reductase alpha subunit